jgi:acetyl esterase/lipase
MPCVIRDSRTAAPREDERMDSSAPASLPALDTDVAGAETADAWPAQHIRPVGGERPLAPRGARAFEGLSYSLVPGYRPLLLDLYVPESADAAPVVLWIHGGAWLFGDRRLPPEMWPAGALFQKIVDAGFAVAAMDYRHSQEAPFPAQLHDAKAAIRYLRRYARDLGIDADRLVVWGESAGAHLAALVGLTGGQPEWEGDDGVREGDTAVAAVVDWYGVHDAVHLELRALPVDPDAVPPSHAATFAREPLLILTDGSALGDDAVRLCSPISHVRADAPPFLLMHGEADGLIPIAQSEVFAAAMQRAGAPVDFRRVAGADHSWIGVDPLPLMDEALAWVTATLEGTRQS